jgi:hypothetical protein
VRNALVFAIAEGNDDYFFFAGADNCFALSVRQGYPSGVQAKLLGFQNQHFAVKATAFFQIRRRFPDYRDVVIGVLKLPIMCHPGIEAFRFVIENLNVQGAFPVQ